MTLLFFFFFLTYFAPLGAVCELFISKTLGTVFVLFLVPGQHSYFPSWLKVLKLRAIKISAFRVRPLGSKSLVCLFIEH